MQTLLCKKAFIAIEAVLYIACSAGAEPVRSKEICEYEGVALRYLEQILQRLVHDGILRGVRGPKGGYFLAKERRRIMLLEIYQSIQALEQASEKPQQLSPLYSKIVQPVMENMQESALSELKTLTIQDLYDQAHAKLDEKAFSKKSDFTI